MNKSTNITSNFLWRFIERIGAQGVSFIVSIVLARILAPSVYGTIALVTVFTTILQVFVDSGFGNALIQKKDADDLDFSTVFFFNIAMCTVLYIAIFFLSPVIANFYKDLSLVPIIRALGLSLIISGVRNVQQAYVSRHMIFKKFFFSTIGGTIGAAIIGIIMAYKGYGVWALVAQQLFNAALGTIILWITVKWRPKFMFSFKRLKILFSYGWKLLASALIDTVYTDIRQLIIGKMYTSNDLAFYNRGSQFPNLIVSNINSSIDSVLLPTMSAEQDDRIRVRAMTRGAIRISSYIMWPLMVGLAVCAKPIVVLLLTDKWLPCVPYLQIFCIVYAFYPIHTANLNAIKAMGRSDLFLKLEIIKKIVGAIAILCSMWFGVMALAFSMLVTTFISQVINSWPNRKLLNYSYKEQIKDIIPSVLLSCLMGAIVYCVEFIGLSNGLTLTIQIVLGAFIYILGSMLFKLESFAYIYNMIKGFISNFKRKRENQK